MRSRFIRGIAWFISAAMPLLAILVVPSAVVAKDKPAAQLKAPKPVVLDAEDVTIQMSVAGFNPPAVEIKTGTTVTWHNTEPADYPVVSGYHQVVADDGAFESPKIAPGARWSFTFLEPGTYTYHCGVHPNMTGTITVTGEPVREEPKEQRVEIVEPDPNNQDTWGYKPNDITVEVGTTVIWMNSGAQDHTVTAEDGSFDSGDMNPGDKFKFTFKKAGVFDYKCTPHPWMTGTVRVHEAGKAPPKGGGHDDEEHSPGPAAPPPPASSGGEGGSGPTTHQVNIVEGASTDDWGYSPESLSIATGDTVVWTNTGEIDHTVTADDGSFDSGTIPPGGTWEYTFDEVGEFQYHCEPHPFMVAAIGVSDSPKEGGGPAVSSGSASGPSVDGTSSGSTSATTAAAAPTAETPLALEGESEAELADAIPAASLAGKEAALGSVLLALVAAVTFLLGQWWGLSIKKGATPAGVSS